MKIKSKIKNYQLVIRVKSSHEESINLNEVDRLSKLSPRGFLRPRILKPNIIEYTGPMGISLYERLKRPINKKDFLLILEQVVSAVQKLQTNGFGIYGLYMNLQNIYMNEMTKEVQFLYIPAVTKLINMNLVALFESIAYSSRPVADQDSGYIARFVNYFHTVKPFTLSKIEEFINSEDISIVATVRKQDPGQNNIYMTDKQKHYYDH